MIALHHLHLDAYPLITFYGLTSIYCEERRRRGILKCIVVPTHSSLIVTYMDSNVDNSRCSHSERQTA